MKKPKISLSKESIVDFFLNHGEKLVVGLFAALACTLVWGGIDAVRTKPAKREQLPTVIAEQAGRTLKHIGESKAPPAETTKRPSLAKLVEPWRENVVATPAAPRLFNAPLSDEKAKRVAPEVLPIVDLRVLPGWAVIAVAQDPNQMMGMQEMTTDNDKDKENDKSKKKQKGKGADPAEVTITPGAAMKGRNKLQGGSPMGPMGPMMGGGEGGSMMAMAPPVMPGKIIPYCLVMGLVPANAQQEAFMKALAASGLQTQNDIPLWSDYRIERAEVPAGAAADAELTWTRIDLQKVAKAAEDWTRTPSSPCRTSSRSRNWPVTRGAPSRSIRGWSSNCGSGRSRRRNSRPWPSRRPHKQARRTSSAVRAAPPGVWVGPRWAGA
jgi:hypothetical protein